VIVRPRCPVEKNCLLILADFLPEVATEAAKSHTIQAQPPLLSPVSCQSYPSRLFLYASFFPGLAPSSRTLGELSRHAPPSRRTLLKLPNFSPTVLPLLQVPPRLHRGSNLDHNSTIIVRTEPPVLKIDSAFSVVEKRKQPRSCMKQESDMWD